MYSVGCEWGTAKAENECFYVNSETFALRRMAWENWVKSIPALVKFFMKVKCYRLGKLEASRILSTFRDNAVC